LFGKTNYWLFPHLCTFVSAEKQQRRLLDGTTTNGQSSYRFAIFGACPYCSAIRTLASIMAKGKSESARVTAATALLDRGWGKPEQSVEVVRKSIREYSDAELLAIAETIGDRGETPPADPHELN
jgi:hypothetical protein